MKNTRMSFKARLILMLLIAGTIPMMVSMYISYSKSNKEMHHEAELLVQAVGSDKAEAVKEYFHKESDALADLAEVGSTREALVQFEKAFAAYDKMDLSDSDIEKIESYYKGPFSETYSKKTQLGNWSASTAMKNLTKRGRNAQYDFIAANENPLGEKDKLVKAGRKSLYAEVHETYHPDFRNHLIRHGLYDIFIVNAQGYVVYSVFKELDFATSLMSGSWSNSGLARAFESSKKLAAGSVHLEDFAPYTPSYESPASFMSTPIVKEGVYLGSLIVQLPLDKISAVVASRSGLGPKDEVLLLGSDLKLRSDSFRNKDKVNVASSFGGTTGSLLTPALKLAQEGKSGVILQNSYDGLPTLAYYQPIKILNLNWYIVTELDQENIFSGLRELNRLLMGVLAGVIVVVGFSAWYFGNSVAKTMQTIIDNLTQSSSKVSSSSTQSASSATELSEAATEQAASLQETMASVEEISAMVNQNADSAEKVKKAVDLNKQATSEGTSSVAEMLGAIGEIKSTNEQILTQMENSNKEFGEIVKIISEIGEKTKVINDIVFQTKLLSFNASVEAARAGEHGKGFAVVAEEVGNLAQMSGNAAKQITDMLSSSIKKVNEIVQDTSAKVDQLVEVGKDKIIMGQSTAEKCRQSLGKISENAQSISMMIAEITNASKEQAQGIQEINKAISQLDQVTQQNSAVAQQSSSQAEQLSVESQVLEQAVQGLAIFLSGKTEEPRSVKAHTSLVSDRVVNIQEHIAKKQVSSSERERMAQTSQKAVGASEGQVVPSSSDGNFNEDF